MHHLGQEDAKGKGEHGEKIIQHSLEIAFRQIDAHKEHVPCLRVGEYLSSLQIGVSVHESAG